jgi:cytoskeleton protein RodZ
VFEIGNSLREARLRQQLDFPELEQQTKIRSKYLRALEEENFDALPAQTYVKGFLRVYAEALGLDGQLYVDEYNSRFVPGEEEPLIRPRRSSVRPSFPARIDTRAVLLALLAIGIVFALVIAAWKYGGQKNPKYQGVNAPSPQAPTPKKPVRKQPTRPARPRPVLARVLLTAAHGPCWLQARVGSASGPMLYEGTLETGQKLPLAKNRIWFLAGAPGNLSATVNGHPVTIPGSGLSGQFVATARGIFQAGPTHA